MEIILTIIAVMIFSLFVKAAIPHKRPEMVNMSLEQAQAMCTPARNRMLTGAYQEQHALGAGGVGGYYEQSHVQAGSREHSPYWEDGHSLPQEAPDMGRVQVHTGRPGAAGNQQELDRWHSLNVNEWERVDQEEYQRVDR